MKKSELSHQIPGVTRADEEKQLKMILKVADDNLNQKEKLLNSLTQQLKSLQEVYDVNDKEGLAQWFNVDSRYKQVLQELSRAKRSRTKPYFGRIDFQSENKKEEESYYIGKTVIAKEKSNPLVIDWRAPIASVYYEKSLGECNYTVALEGTYKINLNRKRTYEIEKDQLIDFYDSDVVANDELLTKYLARNKKAVLSEIIATIQKEQNEIIRMKPQHNVIVQGGAGSGKTTVAMHRISYILYNYEMEFKPKDFYIIGSNQILLNYITGILPDLDVYGILQMTMEQLFIRLLYEEWDNEKYKIKPINKNENRNAIKGSLLWFKELEKFCDEYEWSIIPRQDIVIEQSNHKLMSRKEIETILTEYKQLSRVNKLENLTKHLISRLENEVYGKSYSYPTDVQKQLFHRYQTYFGKKEWSGSIYELYSRFLREEARNGHPVDSVTNEFDLYDLAALAYLYKRIKETETIQEASHVVIDEAQDFGMMAYSSLKYCLSKCTYTIMGDVSQNIYLDYGLTDWEELKQLMLTDPYDYFGLLRKSYRNTVEISNFATNILLHGNFFVYPVEPIIRHGNEVAIQKCSDLIGESVTLLKKWIEKGFETIAVICSDNNQAEMVSNKLSHFIQVKDFTNKEEAFGNGIMVIPIEYAKGLEFDAVLLYDANAQNYPYDDGYAKRLYVAATRALHELAVLYTENLTDLIAKPVSKEKKLKSFSLKTERKETQLKEVEQKTKTELEMQQANEGHAEMSMRNKYGPKRINTTPAYTSGKIHVKQTIGRKVDYYSSIHSPLNDSIPKTKAITTNSFGDVPRQASLKPLGRPNVNLSIRWMTGNSNCIDATNAYGIIRITPILADTVRVSFSKGPFDKLPDVPDELKANSSVRWKCKELRDRIEIETEKLIIAIDKKTSAVSFYNKKGILLLSEKNTFPRQVATVPNNQNWTFFDWGKKESLKAYDSKNNCWVELNHTAKYVSYLDSSIPVCITSNKGYQLMIPGIHPVLCCTIPMYGPYLHIGDDDRSDYFFRTII